MNDRELLELAAKAAGIAIDPLDAVHEPDDWVWWNPLIDDGDALRLAVELHIDVLQRFVGGFRCEALAPGGTVMREDGHSDAATRRAIVRAAAEIGRDAMRRLNDAAEANGEAL